MINAVTPQPVTALAAPTEIDLLLPHRREEPFAAKSHIYDTGAKHFYGLVEGRVGRYREGHPRMGLGFYGPGDWFGEDSLIGEDNTSDVAYALTDVVLMRWTPREVEVACNTPRGAMQINGILATRIRALNERMLEQQRPIVERVGMVLLRLDKAIGQPGDVLAQIPRALPSMTHEMLSWEVGTSREIVTHHMNGMRRFGAIRYNRKGIALWPDEIRKWVAGARKQYRAKPEGEHA